MGRASEVTQTETEFADFYTAHYRRLAAQLYAYLGDHAEAQDITQEAFCRALDRWTRVSGFDDPAGWVRRVGWNLATSRLRHLNVMRRHLAYQRVEHVPGPSPDRVALVDALAKLPAKHRLAVVLHHYGNLSTAEIAEQERVAEGTVRSWLSRGRAQLAGQFLESEELETAAHTPAGVEAATAAVRRRRTARRATLAAALALLLAVPIALVLRGRGDDPPIIGPTTPPASPTPSPTPVVSPTLAPQAISACTGRTLPLPAGRVTAHLEGGDPTGRYLVGTVGNARDLEVPVLWDADVVHPITAPGTIITGVAVNSAGMVAGSSAGGDLASGFKVWTWHAGSITMLLETDDPQRAWRVADLNERGEILLARDGSPAVFEIRTGSLRELPIPAGAERVFVYGLSDDGTVVGSSGTGGQALVWTDDGAVRALPAPEGKRVAATAINGPWVAGLAGVSEPGDLSTRDRHAIRWDLRTGEYVRFPDIDLTAAVTPHGWVLAHTEVEIKDSPTQSSFLHPPVVQMPGSRLPLPSVTGGGAVGGGVISDDGRVIAGEGKARGTGYGTVVRWTCS